MTSTACTHRPLLLVFVLFGWSSIIISPSDAFSLGNPSTALSSSRFARQRLLATRASQGGPPEGRPQQQQQQQPRRSNNNNYNNDRRGPSSPQQRKPYNPPGSKTSPRENMELNKKITQQESAQDLLQLLAGTKGALTLPGGGRMNSINLSTGFHRIGRHLAYQNYSNHNKSNNNSNNANKSNNDVEDGNNRSRILSDPRFALFCCATAEALIGGPDMKDAAGQLVQFRPREMSNVAWAIAKIKIAPPKTALPVDISENVLEQLVKKSAQVRAMVYDVAKQRQGPDGSKGAASTWIPALSELTGLIMDTISYRVVTDNKLVYQSQERANLLWALATAQRADSGVYVLLVDSLIGGVKASENTECRPQEWSNSVWALATASISEPADALLPFVAELMGSKPGFLAEYKPQELGNTAWGTAKILSNQGSIDFEAPQSKAALEICRLVAQEICNRKGGPGFFKSQELSNTAWSFATLGFGLNANKGLVYNVLNDYMVLPSDDPTGDEQLMKAALDTIAQMAKEILHKFRSQELNNLAWSMARLNYKDDELLEGIAYQIANKRRPVTLQDVGTTLWSLASLEFQNVNAFRNMAARFTRDRVMQAKPQELSNTCWALATAEVLPEYMDLFDSSLIPPKLRPSQSQVERDPVTMCFVFAAQELMRRPQEFKAQEIKDILWSFSKVGMRHPELFKSVAEHLMGNGDKEGRGLDEFPPQGIGNTAWSFAKQAQLAEDVIRRYAGQTTSSHTTGRLAVYTASFIDIGEELLQSLFRGIADADIHNHAELSKLKPQDLSNTCWAFSILGLKHKPFLAAAREQVISRCSQYTKGSQNAMTRFKGQELANSLWSLATLNYPFDGVLTQVTPYIVQICTDASTRKTTVASIANAFKRQELANLAWTCAVSGEYPPDLMQILYMGLMGIGENPDRDYVRQIHGDSGIEKSAIMSIIYLQIAMDLDGAANGLSLPEGFPDAWDSNGQSSSTEDTGMMEDGLNLSTSRVQRVVGDAFTRVGFDHVVEHVIRMDTMAQEFGVQMSAIPIEILSIDIAQVDSKIGIEVDGPAHFVSNIDKPGRVLGAPQMINGKAEYQFRWNGDVQETNGPTSLKTRLMERMGWRIISIPFWDWYALKGDPKKEEAYCSKLLDGL